VLRLLQSRFNKKGAISSEQEDARAHQPIDYAANRRDTFAGHALCQVAKFLNKSQSDSHEADDDCVRD